MKPVSEITACIVDGGPFIPVAQRLAREYKRVLYYCPNSDPFPTINRCIIGDGFPDIEKTTDIFTIKNEIDLFVFPDINHFDLQLELESQGFPVWGSRRGDALEIKRQYFHAMLEKLGLPVPKFTVVRGINALRGHLKDEENKYLKISRYRGSMETAHWRSWSLDEGFLDVLAVRFGPAKEMIDFLVFDALETELEIGNDTYCVDGQWPKMMLHGLEKKDAGYFCTAQAADGLPEQIKEVLAVFAPVLKRFRYRNLFSTELRVVDDVGYFTDPCCRGGLPSTSSQLEMLANLPEIIWCGANGELVEPEMAAQFSAEVILKVKCNKTQWPVVEVPEELRQWMKLANCCMIDGRVTFPVDDSHEDEIGWLSAIGDTPKATLDKLKEYVAKLPDGVSADVTALADIFKEIETEQEQGINFTQKMLPEPAAVLE
jgi:hypothetical protein